MGRPRKDERVVVLFSGKRSGWGFDTRKQRYFTAMQVNGFFEKTYNDCTTPEQAIAERDRVYTAEQLKGARYRLGRKDCYAVGLFKVKGEQKKQKANGGINACIFEREVMVKRYEIRHNGRVIKKNIESLMEARRLRNEIFKKLDLNRDGKSVYQIKRCTFCNRIPQWVTYHKYRVLTHECLANYYPKRDKLIKGKAVEAWNQFGRFGKLPWEADKIPEARPREAQDGRIRLARTEAGISIGDMAKMMRISVPHLSYLERGIKRWRDSHQKSFNAALRKHYRENPI